MKNQTNSIESVKERLSKIEEEKKKLDAEKMALDAEIEKLSKTFKVGDWITDGNKYPLIYRIEEIYESESGIKYFRKTKGNPHGSYASSLFRHATKDEICAELNKRAKDAGIIPGATILYKGSKEKVVDVTIILDEKEYNPDKNSLLTEVYFNQHGFVVAVRTESSKVIPIDDVKVAPKYPTINRYEGDMDKNYFIYGCAKIDKQIIKDAYMMTTLKYAGNRTVTKVSITLDSGVTLTHEQIAELYQHTVEV